MPPLKRHRAPDLRPVLPGSLQLIVPGLGALSVNKSVVESGKSSR